MTSASKGPYRGVGSDVDDVFAEPPPSASNRPRLLDLFCGAGGAAVGYHQAGFEVVGVDIKPQPRYPFEFIQADVMELAWHPTKPKLRVPGTNVYLDEINAIHASPPCQAYSSLRALGKGSGKEAPALIEPVRELLEAVGLPYVIENVPGAPLRDPLILCGSMFGLRVRRHRLFETSAFGLRPYCQHIPNAIAVYGDHPENAYIHRRDMVSPGSTKRAGTLAEAQEAMGINWMTWREITQAIPPAYTEWIGKQLLAVLPMAA